MFLKQILMACYLVLITLIKGETCKKKAEDICLIQKWAIVWAEQWRYSFTFSPLALSFFQQAGFFPYVYVQRVWVEPCLLHVCAISCKNMSTISMFSMKVSMPTCNSG